MNLLILIIILIVFCCLDYILSFIFIPIQKYGFSSILFIVIFLVSHFILLIFLYKQYYSLIRSKNIFYEQIIDVKMILNLVMLSSIECFYYLIISCILFMHNSSDSNFMYSLFLLLNMFLEFMVLYLLPIKLIDHRVQKDSKILGNFGIKSYLYLFCFVLLLALIHISVSNNYIVSSEVAFTKRVFYVFLIYINLKRGGGKSKRYWVTDMGS